MIGVIELYKLPGSLSVTMGQGNGFVASETGGPSMLGLVVMDLYGVNRDGQLASLAEERLSLFPFLANATSLILQPPADIPPVLTTAAADPSVAAVPEIASEIETTPETIAATEGVIETDVISQSQAATPTETLTPTVQAGRKE